MRVMVTGGAGYIGSVTVQLLLDRGHEVTVVDNLSTGHKAAVDKRAYFIPDDLLCRIGEFREGVRISGRLGTYDAVIHFAAKALVGESMEQPLDYFSNNVQGGLELLEAMKEMYCNRIIFSSSCATYGHPKYSIGTGMDEWHPQKPVSPYGESKLMFEKILNWCAERNGLKVTILRYFNACGAWGGLGEDHFPETHLIPNVLKAAMAGTTVDIYGNHYATPDHTAVRDYVHVYDLAMAHILALEGGHCGAYNLGNETGHSVKEVIEAARKVTGKNIQAVIKPNRPGDPDFLIADAKKARVSLEWKPQFVDIQEIVASAWEWHQAHPNGYDDK